MFVRPTPLGAVTRGSGLSFLTILLCAAAVANLGTTWMYGSFSSGVRQNVIDPQLVLDLQEVVWAVGPPALVALFLLSLAFRFVRDVAAQVLGLVSTLGSTYLMTGVDGVLVNLVFIGVLVGLARLGPFAPFRRRRGALAGLIGVAAVFFVLYFVATAMPAGLKP